MPDDEYVAEGPYEFAVGPMIGEPGYGTTVPPLIIGYDTVITDDIWAGNFVRLITYTGPAPVLTYDGGSFYPQVTHNTPEDLKDMEDVEPWLP